MKISAQVSGTAVFARAIMPKTCFILPIIDTSFFASKSALAKKSIQFNLLSVSCRDDSMICRQDLNVGHLTELKR